MRFHVCWHRLADSNDKRDDSQPVHLSGEDLAFPWDITFEQALTALERLERLFAEPDGSFVWRPGEGRQIDGLLFDRANRLAYVELRGDAEGEDVDQLLAALNPQGRDLAVQVMQQGGFLRWKQWRGGFA